MKDLKLAFFKDTTKYACRLLSESICILFKRPRKFGKTSFLRVIKLIAEGEENKHLFENTWVYDHYISNDESTEKHLKPKCRKIFPDIKEYVWIKRPVIHIDFSSFGAPVNTMDNFLRRMYQRLISIGLKYKVHKNIQERICISANNDYRYIVSEYFEQLVEQLSNLTNNKTGIVFLLDEYDFPVLRCEVSGDYRGKTLAEFRAECRNWLQSFLTIHKSISEKTDSIHLTVIAGVTNVTFSDLNSGPNHIHDFSFKKELACVCGYTLDELNVIVDDKYIERLWTKNKDLLCFKLIQNRRAPNITMAREMIENIKTLKEKREVVIQILIEQYNGYKFHKDAFTVSNPFSINQCLLYTEFVTSPITESSHYILIDALRKHYQILLKFQARDYLFKDIVEDYLICGNRQVKLRNISNPSTFNDKKIHSHEVSTIASILLQLGVLSIKHCEPKLINRFNKVASEEEIERYYRKEVGSNLKLRNVYTLDCPNREAKELLENNYSIDTLVGELTEMKNHTNFGLEKDIDNGNWKSLFKTIYSKVYGTTAHYKLQFCTDREYFFTVMTCIAFMKENIKTELGLGLVLSEGRAGLKLITRRKIMIIEIKAFSVHPEIAYKQCTKYAKGSSEQGKSLVLCGLSFNNNYDDRRSYRNIHGFYVHELGEGTESMLSCKNISKGLFEDNKIVELRCNLTS